MRSETQYILFKLQLHPYYYPKKNKTVTTGEVGEVDMSTTNNNILKFCGRSEVGTTKSQG